ncbi:MAG: NAD(P)/FAD-dependent oxidoreductase [Aestuariivirga sp.]|nr:NAD(P)/FAD-dependent oxidoreductase [Aestuariivirga sp.]
MRKTDVIIIGGGQSGLVMSRNLTALDVDHVVLERGRIGERWHSERWHSLHLLTANSNSALPGLTHSDRNPEAFMPAREFASYLGSYAQEIAAPVIGNATVTAVEREGCGYRVSTDTGQWHARAVVVATGACDLPFRPAMADALAPSIFQMAPAEYREPGQLPPGGVLVVGASATGIQLAEEIHASGRLVTLAVGGHTRVPRRYRGRDIYAWMDTIGMLDDPALENGNLDAARRQPSLQLVGGAAPRDLDLGVLRAQGIRLFGRLAGLDDTRAKFADDLELTTGASHVRLQRILKRIDDFISDSVYSAPVADSAARVPFLATGDALTLDLQRGGISTVIWATGYIRHYPWLKLPVLDSCGEIIHRGGVAAVPGLYVLGLTFLRRRRSSFIDGCGLDAEDLAPDIKAHLNLSARQVA